MAKIISVKIPKPTVGDVNGRVIQVVLNSLAQKISTDLLDLHVKRLRIVDGEIQIHFDSDKEVS